MIKRERKNTNIRKNQVEQIEAIDSSLDFANRVAWLLDIALKKINNPNLATLPDIEFSVKQWTADERMTAFLIIGKYVAADLIPQTEIVQPEYEEGQLLAKCLKSLISGKKISCSDVIKLASALDVGTEELSQFLQKISIKDKETNGTT